MCSICKLWFLCYFLICLMLTIKSFSIKNEVTEKNSIFYTTNFNDHSSSTTIRIEAECGGDFNLTKSCDSCPENHKCVPKIQCAYHMQVVPIKESPQECDLPLGQIGYCCAEKNNQNVENTRKRRTINLVNVDDTIINEVKKKFHNFRDNLIKHHQKIFDTKKPEFFHNIALHSSIPHNGIHSDDAIRQIFASQLIQQKQNIPIQDFISKSVDVDFHGSPFGDNCLEQSQVACNFYSKYRTFDGTCNNLFRSVWGAAGQPMERDLPPAYEDGIWKPRIHSSNGSPLFSARDVSKTLFMNNNRPHPRYNLLVVQFGQFLSHDLTHGTVITLPNGEDIDCCTRNEFGGSFISHNSNPACFPIDIAPNDDFYKKFNQRCINLVRIAPAPNSNCFGNYAKQINEVTHYLDGSHIYGSNLTTAGLLRTFHGGRLHMFHNFEKDLLPTTGDPKTCGGTPNESKVCFLTGDSRTNEFISLTILHTIFAREHNRIADILAELNPHYSDEILYQETRRIVIAEYQHIIYNEWLPLIVGATNMQKFNLEPLEHGYSTNYDPNVNAAVTSEFTTAALRFGHSAIDGAIHLRSHDHEENIQIPDVQFNPTRLHEENFINDLVQSLTTQPMQEIDDSITYGLSRFLFRGQNPFGLDLASINIQRGRDHAIRPYNDYLQLIGQPRIISFQEFEPEVAAKLSAVYHHPDDIDLWVGGLIEKSFHDSIVGPTFAEIIANQFSKLRRGDRYFYDNAGHINPGHFTIQQLNEIRKVTLARILCDNLYHENFLHNNEISKLSFIRSDLPENSPIECNNNNFLPEVNFNEWKSN